jgi:DNA (cytosine-5)-methyltransferase 1
MVDTEGFKKWLKENSSYSEAVIGDMASRVKRADGIIEWYDEEVYQFYLEQKEQYKCLSVSVRSQIKRAVKLYRKFHARR